MEGIYQKFYAYLVGQIDDTLQWIAGELVSDTDTDTLRTVGEKLKRALLTAEDLYLDEADDA